MGSMFPSKLTVGGFNGYKGSFIAGRKLWGLLKHDVHHNLREKIEKGGIECPSGPDSPSSLIDHLIDKERLHP